MNDMYRELYEKLSRLQWLLQRQHLRNHAEYGPMGDPTRGQGRVLAALKMKPEISMKDLSYLLAIRHQSLNELLNKLERSGYITRTPSETDKRSIMIRLTEKGKNEQYLDRDFGGIFSCLQEEEQIAFGAYLDRVIAALEESLGVEPGAETDEQPYEDFGRGSRPHGPHPDPRDFPPPPPPPPPPHAPHPHGPRPPEPLPHDCWQDDPLPAAGISPHDADHE